MSTDIVYEQNEETVDVDSESIGEDIEDPQVGDDGDDTQIGTEDTQNEAESKIPEKFRDKSMEDVIEAYSNLEKEFGRKNNEIGELRKLTDQFLELQLNAHGKSEPTEEESNITIDDLLDNPGDVINKSLASNPTVKALEKELQQMKLAEAQKGFEAKHNDWKDIVGSKEFGEWVMSSPVRMQMYKAADQGYDYNSAADLLDWYKQVSPAKSPEEKQAESDGRKAAVQNATTESGSTGVRTKKVFRRADLIRLRLENPSKYDAMQDEILTAYQEGRVK